MSDVQLSFLGDACLRVAFEERIDPQINRRCVALSSELERRRLPGVRDIAPGFHTVCVYFDPLAAERDALTAEVRAAASRDMETVDSSELIEIAVHYGNEDGPDLSSVATFAGCSEEEVIRIHSSAVYRVYMVGFLPGFAYLGTVDQRIAMPRLDSPRLKVPAGSVGIAGAQTGVYPCETPGGWRIIGRTATVVFDASSARPSRFRAGQQVKFTPA